MHDRFTPAILGLNRTTQRVLQDYTPLAESLEWELGARYFARKGSLAFLSEHVPVPYAVNNSGALSRQAAELFYTAASTAYEVDPMRDLVVLELGIGLGLFARYFLDAVRDLCAERGTDYYDRIVYVAGDYSERMLLDAVRRGTFADHPGRYRLRVIDALDPAAVITNDSALGERGRPPVFAVFLNYVLDCLPVSVIRAEHNAVPDPPQHPPVPLSRLCVRTCLSRTVNLREYTDLTADDLARLVTSREQADHDQLLDLFGHFTTDYEYRPVAAEHLPYGEFAAEYARQSAAPVVHNHGAIQSLESLLGLLDTSGFILVNDYGSVERQGDADFEHQRYGAGSFVGLDFTLLRRYFTKPDPARLAAGPLTSESTEPVTWAEPTEDNVSIFSRLVGHALPPKVVSNFRARFGKAPADYLEEPAQRARAYASQGRYEAAATAYHTAVERRPWDWLLLREVANLLTFGLADPQTGLEVAKAGLVLNPCCSPDLWNSYGDALAALHRPETARVAYERALAVNADDVPVRLNLAALHLQRKEHAEALRLIAEALARDWRGEYRDRLLQKQGEALVDLARRAQQEVYTLMNRVSRRPASGGNRPPALPGPANHPSAH